jgi:hypothetical protein
MLQNYISIDIVQDVLNLYISSKFESDILENII